MVSSIESSTFQDRIRDLANALVFSICSRLELRYLLFAQGSADDPPPFSDAYLTVSKARGPARIDVAFDEEVVPK